MGNLPASAPEPPSVWKELAEPDQGEGLYRAMVELAQDGIIVVENQVIVYANPALGRQLGYAPEELVGQHVSTILAPDSAELVLGRIARRMAGEAVPAMYECVHRHRDGHRMPAEIHAARIIRGGRSLDLVVIRDTTERHWAEAALHIKDKAIAASINAVAIAGLDGSLAYANKAFLRTWGYGCEQDVLGQPLFSFCRDKGEAAAIIETLCDQGYWFGELLARRRDGSLFDVQLSASRVADDSGRPACMMVSFVDITERKRAETELRRSEEHLRAILENTVDIIYSVTADGILTYVSPQVSRMGYAPEEIVGRNITEFIHPDDVPRTLRDFQETVQTGREFMTYFRMVAKNGQERHFEEYGRAIRSGDRVVQITGVIRDITTRKRAEGELHESEEELKLKAQLLDAVNDSVFLHDAEGNLLYVNEAACRLRGYSREEMLRLTLHHLNVPEFAGLIESRIREILDKGEASFESAHRRKDGSVMLIEVRARAVEALGRKLILSVNRDITERKNAERQLEQLKAELARSSARQPG